MKRMISFIVPVKDRDMKRIKNCVKALKSDITGEIIVIDYGSKKPIGKIPGARVIRYTKNKIWNKAHAINLGIKAAKYDYVGTIDCDIIIPKEFLIATEKHLYNNSFIYSLNVRRVEIKDVSNDFGAMLDNSTYWFKERSRSHINHSANGGIQIYPKKWISNIGGADESLVYWGAIDNDIFERAIMCGFVMVNINQPLLHQEHKFKKEENLPVSEQKNALEIRFEKGKYLDEMFKYNKYLRNCGKWGLEKPNQNKFIKAAERIAINDKKYTEDYMQRFIKATKLGKESFEFNGKTIKLYK